ncbi:hypothetical protein G9Q38_01335 [Pusillimonas sp. DMV24BSW_D]|uniref:hypothetical protein n=1 Tax=Neopusillimonas aestuarii TaxID=2716226 RepID=UPI00140D047B|nr:hypothetical protein [Pusillimonas sp. DMV24BSW_D]QIM47917.1 hypothetical protein G9Q38_01335 [Pusillimonas sp. DMV24BSW_D]
MNHDSLVAVAEDLEYLSQWGSEITAAEIRRGTAVLRRLLVEDAYGIAWRTIGQAKQPSLIAIDLDQMLGGNSHKVIYALAGGAHFRGMHMACMLLNKGDPISQNPPTPIRQDGYPFERRFTVSEYLSSNAGVVEGRSFNRRDVIKYLANIKGGVHLSAQQRKTEIKLISRLGKIEKKMMLHATDGLLVEAVAIAQALGTSADAKTYMSHIKAPSSF